MVAANWNEWVSSATALRPAPRLAQRIRHYFDQHPEVSRGDFLLQALQREIYLREQPEADHRFRTARRGDQASVRWSNIAPPPTAEDIRIHAWSSERLAALHRERHGLWPKLRRFLFGWLGERS
jgi:hypothetical protein